MVEPHTVHLMRTWFHSVPQSEQAQNRAPCALCGTLWNHVRVKCTVCGSTKGISYQEITGSPGTVKAECCSECRSYVKILEQRVDPALDAVADDVGSLGLDLLMRDSGLRRAGVDHFLLGY